MTLSSILMIYAVSIESSLLLIGRLVVFGIGVGIAQQNKEITLRLHIKPQTLATTNGADYTAVRIPKLPLIAAYVTSAASQGNMVMLGLCRRSGPQTIMIGQIVAGLGALLIPMTTNHLIVDIGMLMIGLGWSATTVASTARTSV
jgi:hypothetical protein